MDVLTLFKPTGTYTIDRLYSLLEAAGNPEGWNKAELQKQVDAWIGTRVTRQVDVLLDGKVVWHAYHESDLPPVIVVNDRDVPMDDCDVVPVYWLLRCS